jgi:hypothetical protein
MRATRLIPLVVFVCLSVVGCSDAWRVAFPAPKPKTLLESIERHDYATFQQLLPTRANELNAFGEGGNDLATRRYWC